MRKFVAIVLIVLAVAMLYLGFANQMLPPALTGVGFAAIGILLLWEEKAF